MLKEIIKKCALLLNRSDITDVLDNVNSLDEIEDKNIYRDVIVLIGMFNKVVCTIFENYLDLVFSENIVSNFNSEIPYNHFSKNPIKILKIENQSGNLIVYKEFANAVKVGYPHTLYNVTYKFVPRSLKNLTDDVGFLYNKYIDVICYGVISDFLASRAKYTESDFWRKKFLYELFYLNSKRERRVKSGYCL